MSEKKSKNIVIIALCITLIFMGVGFAALSQTLTINGTANVTGSWDIKITNIEAVEVKYAGLEVSSANKANFAATSGSKETPVTNSPASVHGLVDGLNSTAATFDVDLNEPGDYVIYKVTVTNGGTIAAKLATTNGITLTDDSPEVFTGGTYTGTAGEGMKLFAYTMQTESSGSYSVANDLGTLASGMGTLAAGSTHYYYVKVLYNNTALTGMPDEAHNSATGTLTLSYVQNS